MTGTGSGEAAGMEPRGRVRRPLCCGPPRAGPRVRGRPCEGRSPRAARQAVTTVARHFSSEGVAPVPWTEARSRLGAAEVFWVSTVRPDGRPHVTPLIAVWLDEAL